MRTMRSNPGFRIEEVERNEGIERYFGGRTAMLAIVQGDWVVVPLSEIMNIEVGGPWMTALLMGECTLALTAQLQTHLDPFG